VEIKPNPHPERPDRVRAIAASLAAAGAYHYLSLLVWLFDSGNFIAELLPRSCNVFDKRKKDILSGSSII
jgi:hypothetical protein